MCCALTSRFTPVSLAIPGRFHRGLQAAAAYPAPMKSTRKLLVLAPTLLLLAASPGLFQDPQPQDKKQKVLKLLEVTGAADMGKKMMDQMLDQFRRMPGLPPGFIEEFKRSADTSSLSKLIVPIYMKHVEEKDLDGVLAFMSTDIGKRWLAAQPKIAEESMKAGQDWGRKTAQEVMQKLRKR